jgi:hypothetical protein
MWGDGSDVCWGCGVDGDAGLEKAHVIPVRFGGSMDPSNFFILCPVCHIEQPDAAPRAVQEEWLKARETQGSRIWTRYGGEIMSFVKRYTEAGGTREHLEDFVKNPDVRAFMGSVHHPSAAVPHLLAFLNWVLE